MISQKASHSLQPIGVKSGALLMIALAFLAGTGYARAFFPALAPADRAPASTNISMNCNLEGGEELRFSLNLGQKSAGFEDGPRLSLDAVFLDGHDLVVVARSVSIEAVARIGTQSSITLSDRGGLAKMSPCSRVELPRASLTSK